MQAAVAAGDGDEVVLYGVLRNVYKATDAEMARWTEGKVRMLCDAAPEVAKFQAEANAAALQETLGEIVALIMAAR